MPSRQSGFTLVEIAIVLVIIGLLLGGILKGQELVVQARIKNVANDLNGVSAAVYSYQDRYRALPGDDAGAAARWAAAGISGNGNGRIEPLTATPAPPVDEQTMFWRHLRLSGLIGGDNASAADPLNAAGGTTVVRTGGFGLGGLTVCSTQLPARIAAAIDAQFDDGLPNTGSVRGAATAATISTTAPTATTNAYVDTGSELYDICKNL